MNGQLKAETKAKDEVVSTYRQPLLKEDSVWLFTPEKFEGSLPFTVKANYEGFSEGIKVGDELVIDGGMACFEVIERLASDLRCKCTDPSLFWPCAKFSFWRDGQLVKRNYELPTLSTKALKNKESKHGGQAMVILNWLFQEEVIFRAIATAMVGVLATKDDRFVVLGWCTFVRALVDYESSEAQFSMSGIRDRYPDLLKILTSSIPHLVIVLQKGSTLQDGFELPSRLAVSAADCFLALSEALIKKAKVSSNKPKLSDSKVHKRPVTLVAVDSGDKKANAASESLNSANMELDYILWEHLEEVLGLVQKLLAVTLRIRMGHRIP